VFYKVGGFVAVAAAVLLLAARLWLQVVDATTRESTPKREKIQRAGKKHKKSVKVKLQGRLRAPLPTLRGEIKFKPVQLNNQNHERKGRSEGGRHSKKEEREESEEEGQEEDQARITATHKSGAIQEVAM